MSRAALASACALAALALGLVAPRSLPAAEVDLTGDLFLGVWSPARTRWLASVPACVRSDDPLATAYRVTANGIAADAGFAMASDIGDTIVYIVEWFADGDTGPRERLTPGVASRRTYPFRSEAQCAGGETSTVRVRAGRRSVDLAPPGIYRDSLVLTVSPI